MLYAEDSKHLAGKARNYLNDYLDADPQYKDHVRRAVAVAAQRCREIAGINQYWSALDQRTQNSDARATIDASAVAIRIAMQGTQTARKAPNDDADDSFNTATYATIALAYRSAAGIYRENSQLNSLGAAALMLVAISESTHN